MSAESSRPAQNRDQTRDAETTYQCVMSIVSGPLIITLAPSLPAIFESSDCAHVSVMEGRSEAGGRYLARKGGGVVEVMVTSRSEEGVVSEVALRLCLFHRASSVDAVLASCNIRYDIGQSSMISHQERGAHVDRPSMLAHCLPKDRGSPLKNA